MVKDCCSDSPPAPVLQGHLRASMDSSDSSDASSACNDGCCGSKIANITAVAAESERSAKNSSACGGSNAQTLATNAKDGCCGTNTTNVATKSGCCGSKNTSVRTDNKPSCCALTEKCDDKCVVIAADTQDESNSMTLESRLEHYRALLESARCICQSVFDERGFSCCDQKKSEPQPTKSKTACSSNKKLQSDIETNSDCNPPQSTPNENALGVKTEGCCTKGGKTISCGFDAKPTLGTCSSKKSSTACSSISDTPAVKKGGCCSSTRSPPGVKAGGCGISALSPSEAKKDDNYSSLPTIPDGKKGGCCSSTTEEIVMKTEVSATIKRAKGDTDLENDAGFEHVALSVEGMTCNDCAEKLAKTLFAIPGTHNIRVNFVRGQADFDIEQSLVDPENVLLKARAATGFIIHRIKQGTDETLHLLVSEPASRALADVDIEGLTDVTVVNKTTVSVDYDPTVVGARDLLEKIGDRTKGLAPPGADPAVSGGRRKYQKLLAMTLVATVLTIPVVTLAWGEDLVSEYTRGIVSFALGSLVQLLAVPVFYKPALRALIVYHSLELDMLVVVSITAAYMYSVVAFSFRLAGRPLETAEFFETSTLLITLIMFGRLLASYARVRAVAAVSMRSLQSTTALLVDKDGKNEQEIDSRLLQYGDLFKVLPHCRIPTDGVVVHGTSDVDESMLTGESIPVTKQPGSNIIAGTINSAGTLLVELTELPGKNTITDIARMVDEASDSKPRVQDLADHVASYFLPVVSGTALVILIIWIIVGLKLRDYAGGEAVAVAVTYAIAVLAVSCPCALGLAVPMVLVIAGGIAARGGILIKSAECTERSRKVTDIVFDKTGTLTEPDLDVINEEIFGNNRDKIASIVQALVSDSKHPVSVAIAKYLGDNAGAKSVSGLQSIPGFGVEAHLDGVLFRAGNPQWTYHQEHPKVREFLQRGLTVLLVTREASPVALFGLRTRVRPEAVKVIDELKRRGITIHLVSGDQPYAVDAVASLVGVDSTNAVAQYTPGEKQEYVAKLMNEGKYVFFCGDGTNDAVAVAQAHIGAQVSDSLLSSDVTGGAADVVLLSGLNGIPFLLDVSKAAYRRIVFNFVWSAVYNVLAILLAAGAFVKIRIPPAYAGAGELVSVLPVIAAAMSMLLLKLKP